MIRHPKSQILLIGIGNSGRRDDGLGWAFLERLEKMRPENVTVEYRYQLQIEDAELISHYARVLFVDADTAVHENGFAITSVEPLSAPSYTSHRLTPEAVLALAQKLYRSAPECRLLGITGRSFELAIGLTPEAEENLRKALGSRIWEAGQWN
ncbi:MAG: hydrogenase maturation protease [Acidobacteria bacterium]|nr:hydrogenase maturation protease [Acidobacteriota bacterium]